MTVIQERATLLDLTHLKKGSHRTAEQGVGHRPVHADGRGRPMTATIRLSPGQVADSLTLRNTSALAYCTDVDGDDAGVFIATRWDRISSGEELLWRVLDWVNGASDLPTRDDLAAGLDPTNAAAAFAAIGVAAGVGGGAA